VGVFGGGVPENATAASPGALAKGKQMIVGKEEGRSGETAVFGRKRLKVNIMVRGRARTVREGGKNRTRGTGVKKEHFLFSGRGR